MKNPFEELIKEVRKYEEDIDMVSREVESSENKAREINIAENKKTLFVTDKETEEVIIFKWEGETPITDEGIQDIFSNLPMIKREQSLRRMEAEQPPEKYIKNPTLYGIRGAEKAIMKDFVEPAVMIAGGASGTSLHPALGPVGTGVGLSAARKGTEWFEKELGEQPSNPSVMKNIIEGTVVGLAGELIPPVFSGIGKGTKAVINKVINILPAFTEKKAMQKVGNKLLKDLDIIDKDPLSKEAIKMAEEVMDTINGFTVPLAGQSGHPQLLQEFRAMIKSPGNASEKYAEQIVSNNQAIRNALNKTMTGNVDDLINVVNQRKDIMTGKIADLSTGVTKQQLGNKLVEPVIGLIPFNREIDKAAHKLAFKKIPNVPVPQQPITDIVDELKREITKVNAYKYPEDTIAAISDLLKKGKIEVVDPMGGKIVGEKIGFENWHDIRKRISKEAWEATQGMNPNYELQRNLLRLQSGIEKAIDLAGIQSGEDIAVAYKVAKTLYADYARIYKSGAIKKVTQQGAEVTGLKKPLSEMTEEFTTLDGADGLKEAIGLNNANIIMREHYNLDLSDYLKGGIDPIKIDRWLNNQTRKAVLQKYGLFDEFTGLASELKDYEIVNKIAGVDLKKIIPSILGGGKEVTLNAKKLMDFAKGNQKVIQGIQKATGDFILDEIETTGMTRAGDYALSNAKIVNVLDKYKPALEIIYKDNPEKFKMLTTIQEGIELMNRLAKSPTGGGSDTFELTGARFGGLMRYIGNRIGAVTGAAALGGKIGGTAGAVIGAGTGMIGWELLSNYSENNVNRFLVKATFDPNFASTLVMMAQGAPKELISKRLAQQMATIIFYEVQKEVKKNKLEHVKELKILQ